MHCGIRPDNIIMAYQNEAHCRQRMPQASVGTFLYILVWFALKSLSTKFCEQEGDEHLPMQLHQL